MKDVQFSPSQTGDANAPNASWFERVKSKLHEALTRVRNTFGGK
jgi:hypothetical protein